MLVPKKDLVRALAALRKVARQGSPMPALRAVEVDVLPAAVSLRATDLETYAHVEVPGSPVLAEPVLGRVAVDLKALHEVARAQAGKQVEVGVEDGALALGSARLPALVAVEDLPLWPSPAWSEALPEPAEGALEAALRVAYAAGDDPQRPALRGVRLAGGTLVAATDGHRLAMENALSPFEATIPTLALQVLHALKASGLAIGQTEQWLVLSAPGALVACRRPEAREYPGVVAVVDRALAAPLATLSVDVEALASRLAEVRPAAAARARAFSGYTRPEPFVALSASGGALYLRAGAPDTGEASASLPLRAPAGFSMPARYWAVDYLADALGQMEGGPVDLSVPEKDLGPAILRQPGRLALVMPVDVKEGE